jgi:anti-sigma factor RsiW
MTTADINVEELIAQLDSDLAEMDEDERENLLAELDEAIAEVLAS